MKPTKVSPDELFERVQAAWDHARKDRPMPRRQEIDAVKLGALLPYVGLIDVIHGESIDLRYRLVGAQTTQSFGLNLTGLLHSTLNEGRTVPSRFFEACRLCVETHRAQTVEITDGRNRKDLPFQVTARVWPLSEDGTTVTCLLGGAIFRTLDPAAVARPSA